MMRFKISVLLVLAVACGGTRETVAINVDTTSPVMTTVSPASAPVTSEAVPEATLPPNAPMAPDFILALGNGGVFSLEEEKKPVYLVFWAEW